MIVSFYKLTTGEITMVNDVLDVAEAIQNIPIGCGYVLGEGERKTEYVDTVSMEIIDRPVVPVFSGVSYDLTQLQPTAHLVVTDEVDFSTDVPAQPDTLELTDPGVYQVKSVSPFPWIDFATEVIVP
jgi:hypothetical protein